MTKLADTMAAIAAYVALPTNDVGSGKPRGLAVYDVMGSPSNI